MREEVKYSLQTHTKDCLPLLKQMRCLSYDFRRFELNQGLKGKKANGEVEGGDLMRDFKQPESSTATKRTKEEETAFEALSGLK